MAGRLVHRRHDAASQAYFEEVKQLARSQRRVLPGTPGTLKQRTQSGNQYWVREYIRVDGKKTDEYVGAVAATEKATVERVSHEIELAKALAASSGRLRLLGYQRVDRKPAAVLQVLFNRGLLEAGLTLVGSHAYGALLNDMGVIAQSYKTQDIDLARCRQLSIALPAGSTFQSLLRDTGLNFVPVPGMPSNRPSSSFKLPGAEIFAVDLLAAGDRIGTIIPVPELMTHAQAIPLLDFLITDAVDTVAVSYNQIIPVRVPSPQNFALHKIYSSQSRTRGGSGKVRKDLDQAAVLAAAIAEQTPGRLLDAFKSMPKSGKAAVKRGCGPVLKLLGDAHEEAKGALARIAGK
ncbi:MAG: GSU2403 family nucleotidyltransferase fold protein [Betaproteobacteria bacterium]